MLKLQRNYRADITIGTFDEQTGDRITTDNIILEPPITCNLLINVGSYTTSNAGVFQFINLSQRTRAKLWLDVYERGKKWLQIKFYAGYNKTMPLIYQGEGNFCLSSRSGGRTEWITELQTQNNGDFFKYGFLNTTFTEGTDLKDILKVAFEKFPNLKVGYITPDIQPLPRNKTFIGQTWDILGRSYGGYDIFLDQFGNFNILGDNDVIPGEIQVISEESGLLGVPRRANVFVEVDTIFEPQLRTGQTISLVSKLMPSFNQAYKVINVKHQGIISPAQSGQLITTVTLATIIDEPRVLTNITQETYSGSTTTGQWRKPVQGIVSSLFGRRTAPIKGASTNHKGMDIAASYNTPIYAPANGRVFFNNWNDGYGKCIKIDHGTINGKKVTSLYGHLNSIQVDYNQIVYEGNQIGLVGSTGNSDGPHLHFEVREDGTAVNPTKYIGNY